MHQTNNRSQSCQQPKLREPYAKRWSNYKLHLKDPDWWETPSQESNQKEHGQTNSRGVNIIYANWS